MPNRFGNLNGLLSLLDLYPLDEILKKIAAGEVDLVYYIGDAPFEKFSNVKYKIYQNAFPAPSGLDPDVILPASIWGESEGSYLSSTGKVKNFKAIAAPQGYSLSHQEVLGKIITAMALPDLTDGFTRQLDNVALPDLADGFTRQLGQVARHKKPGGSLFPGRNNAPVHHPIPAVSVDYPFLLLREKDQHVYNNLSLSNKLEGFGELVRPGHVMLNPADARIMDVKNNDIVELASAGKKNTYQAVIRKNIMRGFLFLQESDGKVEFETNPCPVNIRRKNV